MWSATRTVAGAACKIAVALTLFLPAFAAEAKPSAEGYRAELDQLGTQIAKLDEEYNVAKIRLSEVDRQIRDTQKGKSQADDQLKLLRKTASARAAAMYRVGFPGLLIAFFGSHSQAEFSRKMGATSKVGSWESGLMSSLQLANQNADQRTQDLRVALASAKSIRDSVGAKRAALEARQTEQKNLLDRFVAAAARVAKGPRNSKAAQLLNGGILGPRIQAGPIALPSGLSASGGAKSALETAFANAGKPYQWGAAGPGSFDCSGLTMFAWRSAGVSLPHSSRAQFEATKRVGRSELQPGDLVFFGSPIHHVGIYVGDGKMINSPETGERVGVRSMERGDYVGGGRPGI